MVWRGNMRDTPMKRFFLAVLCCLAVFPARGENAFTPEQRAQIVQVVREALKADPSILRDAIISLQADDQAREAADTKSRVAAQHQALLANPGDPVAGNPAGDVTVVEFYDPRCPYCRRMLPTIDALLKKDHGVRLVFKDIPVLGPASTTESRAILAAQKQGGYLKMQSALMNDPAEPTAQMLREAARGAGLDPAKLAADMNGADIAARIKQNLDLAHALRVDGTPVFVVGSQMFPGAMDQATLESAISIARKHS